MSRIELQGVCVCVGGGGGGGGGDGRACVRVFYSCLLQ